MAWAAKLSEGRYRAGYRDSAGKAKYVKDATGRNAIYGRKSDAVRAGSVAEDKYRRQAPIATSTTSKAANQTWGEWWDCIGGNRHPGSDYDRREKSIVDSQLRPQWGAVQLNRISNRDVKVWIKELSASYAPNYVHRIYFVFKTSLQEAMDTDPPILNATPCTGKIGLPKVAKQRAKSYLTQDDLDLYREAGMRSYLFDWLTFEYETGMRPSEISGLHAKWINPARDQLEVADTLVAGLRVIRSYPKNSQHRVVNLTDEASAILERQLTGRDLQQGCGMRHMDGKPCTSTLVFRTPAGGVIIPQYVNTAMRRVAERAGFERKTPYSARRGFGTWAIDGGMPSMKVQKQMGHSTPQETEGYVQRSPQERDQLRAARRKANDQ